MAKTARRMTQTPRRSHRICKPIKTYIDEFEARNIREMFLDDVSCTDIAYALHSKSGDEDDGDEAGNKRQQDEDYSPTSEDKEEQKQELNDELELRNKELVSSAIQILRKSEEMKQTISSLQELNERANPEDSELLLTVIRKLKMELEHSSWEEFEVPFKQLHSRFFTKLVELYPELTRAEIKVCALLKLNLDTKQISSILHKTSASIEVDRSRIRKKMRLTNSKTSLPPS